MTLDGDAYKVRLEIFEGPMDLLLHLIRVNEMDIYDISIAKITEQYLEYLKLMKDLDLEVAGEFLVMAATLVSIKLRSLLPAPVEEEEEGEEVDDILTAQTLMEKLVEYRKFKEASAKLQDQGVRQADVFFREAPLPRLDGAAQSPELQMDVEKLLAAFGRVLRFVEQRNWHLVTEEKFTVEEKIDELEQRLLLEPRIDVEEMFRNCRSKLEMIVYLLAMLELAHLQRLAIEQAGPYAPIYVLLAPQGPPAEDVESEQEENRPAEIADTASPESARGTGFQDPAAEEGVEADNSLVELGMDESEAGDETGDEESGARQSEGAEIIDLSKES